MWSNEQGMWNKERTMDVKRNVWGTTNMEQATEIEERKAWNESCKNMNRKIWNMEQDDTIHIGWDEYWYINISLMDLPYVQYSI